MLLGAIAMLLTDLLLVVSPKLQAMAMTAIEHGDGLTQAIWYSAGIVGVIAFAGIFRYLWRIFFIFSSLEIAYELRNDFFGHLLGSTPGFFQRHTTGDIMARATNDIDAVRMATGPGIVFSIDIIVLGLASAIIMLVMNWQLALIALVPLPFIAVFVHIFEHRIHVIFDRVQAIFSLMSEKARENISGIRIVKNYGIEDIQIDQFGLLSRDYVRENKQLYKVEGLFRPTVGLFATSSIILILVFGLNRVIDKTMTLGDYWAFYEYIWLVVGPMTGIGWIVSLFQRGTASLTRLATIMDEQPDIIGPSTPVTLPAVKGRLEFQGVSVRYPETTEDVLSGIDLTIEAGEKIGITGRVASGKSTFISLLFRFLDPTAGTIRLDGIDIRDISLQTLRAAFGYVAQEPYLFSDSIRGNIGFGLDMPHEADVRQSAAQADCLDTIEGFPDTFSTVVGERGIMLSGGQRQRIALARAILVAPPVLVLDDAFSHLDIETEQRILDAMEEVWRARTVLLVSHRIETLRRCDRIIIFEAGRVTGQGTHDELLTSNAFYRWLDARQKLLESLQ